MAAAGKVDFLGIGAERSGSTWLWKVLRSHPGIWMPIQKELHYFDRSLRHHSPTYLASERFTQRMFGRGRRNRKYREVFVKGLYRAIIEYHSLSDTRWMLRYLLGRVNDDWYLSLFEFGGSAIKGEITPTYSVLESSDVQRVHSLLPKTKVLYVLRNPVERAWSQLRFNLRGEKNLDALQAVDSVRELIGSRGFLRRSDYLPTLRLWRTLFGDEQVFVGFFDDIQDNAPDLARRLYSFLGVDPAFVPAGSLLKSRVNAAAEAEMPAAVRALLVEQFRPEIDELARRLGGPALRWQAEL